MKLKIEIELDNAAFECCPITETERILTKYIKDCFHQDRIHSTSLIDLNGNKVGEANIIK